MNHQFLTYRSLNVSNKGREAMTEALVDIDQLAQLMHRTTDSIYQARKRGTSHGAPNAFKIGRKVYWRRSTVDAWFRELETEQNGRPSRTVAR